MAKRTVKSRNQLTALTIASNLDFDWVVVTQLSCLCDRKKTIRYQNVIIIVIVVAAVVRVNVVVVVEFIHVLCTFALQPVSVL